MIDFLDRHFLWILGAIVAGLIALIVFVALPAHAEWARADLGVSELVRARIFGRADLDGRVARLERRLEELAPRRRRAE